jgi:hypothetical protein
MESSLSLYEGWQRAVRAAMAFTER